MRALLVLAGLSVLFASEASAAPRPVTLFLERDGRVIDHDGDRVVIPKFGGGDRVWSGVVGCVKQQFSPFNIDIVDQRPARGEFITAVIGGRASQLGLDDRSTNGVGPYSPDRVIRNAVVHIFSRVGSGERDVSNLCSVTVHEVSHALGLDHTYKCGDVMSYFLDRCGPRRFLDVEAPCGEDGPRTCGDGKRTQSSYRKVVAAVGLRGGAEPEPEPEPAPDGDDGSFDPWGGDEGEDHEGYADEAQPEDPYEQDYDSVPQTRDEPQGRTRAREPQGHSCGGQGGQRYTVEQVEHDGRRYYVIRRAR
jgi:hypothetical protein